jgi:hypothetical protein
MPKQSRIAGRRGDALTTIGLACSGEGASASAAASGDGAASAGAASSAGPASLPDGPAPPSLSLLHAAAAAAKTPATTEDTARFHLVRAIMLSSCLCSTE